MEFPLYYAAGNERAEDYAAVVDRHHLQLTVAANVIVEVEKVAAEAERDANRKEVVGRLGKRPEAEMF